MPRNRAFKDILDEMSLLCWVFLTFGLIYLLVRIPDHPDSKIHWLFKYFDFFEKTGKRPYDSDSDEVPDLPPSHQDDSPHTP